MTDNDLQEPLQALPPMLDHIITKTVCEDLPRQRRDGNARRLPLQDVAEVFEIGVPPTHAAVSQLEGWDVGPAENLVVGVHAAAHAMGAWVLDLKVSSEAFSCDADSRA